MRDCCKFSGETCNYIWDPPFSFYLFPSFFRLLLLFLQTCLLSRCWSKIVLMERVLYALEFKAELLAFFHLREFVILWSSLANRSTKRRVRSCGSSLVVITPRFHFIYETFAFICVDQVHDCHVFYLIISYTRNL